MGPRTGDLSCPLLLPIFLGFLEESSPHASLEASSARSVARRVRFYSDLMAHGDDVDGARAAKANCCLPRASTFSARPYAAVEAYQSCQRPTGQPFGTSGTQDGGANRQDLRALSKQASRLEATNDARARARSPGITAPALRRPAQLRGPARRHGQRLRRRVEFEFERRGADLRRRDGRSAARARISTEGAFSRYERRNAAAQKRSALWRSER